MLMEWRTIVFPKRLFSINQKVEGASDDRQQGGIGTGQWPNLLR